jgi:hypothetical protein
MTSSAAYMKKWHKEHKEEEKLKRAARKDSDKETRLNNYWRNVEDSRKKQRDEYARNREKKIAYQKKYVSQHKEKILSKIRADRAEWKSRAVSALGGVCVRCGFSDGRALQIDHVGGNGALLRKSGEPSGSSKYYKIVVLSAEHGENVYQLLCCNCNWIKRVEDKEVNQYTIKDEVR